MAQTESPVVANVVVEAVVDSARSHRKMYGLQTGMADNHRQQAQELHDEAATHRANWESCIDWLDENVPDWELVVGDEDIRSVPSAD